MHGDPLGRPPNELDRTAGEQRTQMRIELQRLFQYKMSFRV